MHIVLKDSQGKTIDTLFKDSVRSVSDLEKLEAPHFKGGKAVVSVVGFKDDRIAYQVDRKYDAGRKIVESVVPYVVPGSSLKLDYREMSIPVKKTLALPVVTIEPKDLVSKEVQWISLQEKIVRVDEEGLRGLALGWASIIVSLASDTSKKDTLRVTVTARPSLPETIRILPDTLTLAANGRSVAFTLTPTPATASKAAAWILSDSAVAKVDKEGVVKGRSPGVTSIRAISTEDSEVADTAWVKVVGSVPVESVRFMQDSVELFEGGTPVLLEYEVLPNLASTELTYGFSDPTVLQVKEDTVKPLKSGLVLISAYSTFDVTRKDSLWVTVHPRQKVDSVAISQDTVRLYLGGPSQDLTAQVFPLSALQRVDWKSSDVALVQVDITGKTSPIAIGKASVIAISRADSSKLDRTVVLVKKDTPLLSAGRPDTTVPVGATVAFRLRAPQEYGRIIRLDWDFEGDGTWDGDSDSLGNLSYLYSRAGEFPARFRVLDTEGNDTTISKLVRVVVGPVIQIHQPANNFQTNQPIIDVAWSVDNVDQTTRLKETLALHGPNTITRSTKDSAGIIYSASITVYYDTVPPARPKLTGNTPVNTRVPTWTWSSGGNGGNGTYRYRLDDDDMSGARTLQDTSFTPATDLSPGTHTLFVQERDAAGNWSLPGQFAISIDLTSPPSPVAASSHIDLSNSRRPTWRWISGGGDAVGIFRYQLDNNDFSLGSIAVSTHTFTPASDLTEGMHVLFIQERDSAGNWSNITPIQVRIDLTPPPSPSLDSTPYSPQNTLRPTWTWKSGSGGMGVYRCKIDNDNMNSGTDTLDEPKFKPAAALLEGTRTLYVQERDSAGNWSTTSARSIHLALRKVIGGSGFSTGAIEAYYSNLQIDALGELYVSFQEGDNGGVPVVRKYSGGSWVALGNPGSYGVLGWTRSMALSPAGVPHIALKDTSGKGSILRFVQGTWETLGPLAFTPADMGEAALAFTPSGVPLVAYRDGAVGKAVVQRFNGTSWDNVGPRGISEGFTIFHTLSVSKAGVPYVAYLDIALGSDVVVVKRYRTGEDSWETLPMLPAHSKSSSPVHLVLGKGDSVFLALTTRERDAPEVYKLAAASWEKVGGSVSPEGAASGISFTIDSAGNKYLAYMDIENGRRISMKSFRNNLWVQVGPLRFTTESGVGGFLSSCLATDLNGVPHLLYSDAANSKRATLIRTAFDP